MGDMTKTLMKSCANAIAILGVLILSTSPQAANEEASAEKAAQTFDHAMLSIFHRSQKELTANTRPIMIIARDVTVVSKDGEVSYPRNALQYNALKSVSHVLLGIIGAVTPWPEGDAGQKRWMADFAKIKSEIDTFLASIDGLGLEKESLADQRAMLEKARAFVEDALNQGRLTPEAVAHAINDMRPMWAKNMRRAAHAELTTLHAAVSDARAAMEEKDWADMYVVAHGRTDVRKINVVLNYLQRVMPEKFAAGQVLFAENTSGKEEIIKYVGYIKMQRHVGAWAFGNPGRMEVDLLGYEAGSVLDELIEVAPPASLSAK